MVIFQIFKKQLLRIVHKLLGSFFLVFTPYSHVAIPTCHPNSLGDLHVHGLPCVAQNMFPILSQGGISWLTQSMFPIFSI
jgi:hypothetical protein